jgi:hypothetical protein
VKFALVLAFSAMFLLCSFEANSRTVGSCNDDAPHLRDPSCPGYEPLPVERVVVTGSRGTEELDTAVWTYVPAGSTPPSYSAGITRRELAPGASTRTVPACERERLAIRSVLSWLRAGENPGKEIPRYRGNMHYPSGIAWGKFYVQFDYTVTQLNRFGVVMGVINGSFQIHYEYNFDSKDYTQPHFAEDSPPSAGCKGQGVV